MSWHGRGNRKGPKRKEEGMRSIAPLARSRSYLHNTATVDFLRSASHPRLHATRFLRPLSCKQNYIGTDRGGGGKCSDDNRRESRSRRSCVMPSLSLGESLPFPSAPDHVQGRPRLGIGQSSLDSVIMATSIRPHFINNTLYNMQGRSLGAVR